MFKVFWLSAKDLFDELFLLLGINLIWVLINLPFAVIVSILVSTGAYGLAAVALLLAVLPLGPANAGLYAVVERVTDGRTASMGVFFEGLRQNAKLSWQVYGLWMCGLLLILVNLQFYAGLTAPLGAFLQVLFLYILVVWLALLIYLGPLMRLQIDKRIRTVARNAFLMALGRPIFTIGTLILMGLLLILSVLLPPLLLLVTFAFLGLWGFRATIRLIKDAEDRRAALEEQAAAASGPRPNAEKGRRGQVRPRE